MAGSGWVERAVAQGWRSAPDGNLHRVDALRRRGAAVAYEVRYRVRSARRGLAALAKLDVRRQDGEWEPVSVEEVPRAQG